MLKPQGAPWLHSFATCDPPPVAPSPRSSSIPAEDPLKLDECRMAGRWDRVRPGGCIRLPEAPQGAGSSGAVVAVPLGVFGTNVCAQSAYMHPARSPQTRRHPSTHVSPAPSPRYMLELLKADLKPKDILTYKAFENAMVTVMATGGSTNAVLHFIAMAR